QSASGQFELDALRAERWLASKAAEPATADVLAKPAASPSAQGGAATALSDAILGSAKQASVFNGAVPSLVVVLDAHGKTIGRNGVNLGRDEDLSALFPPLKDALSSGKTGSDIWFVPEKSFQYLTSYAPVRDEAGRVVGGIAVGFTLNDELSRVSEATTGRPLRIVAATADGVQVVASSAGGGTDLDSAITAQKDGVKAAIAAGHVGAVTSGDMVIAVDHLDGIGDGKRAIATNAPASFIENVGGILLPAMLGVTVLGLILVVVGGWLLGSYITGPIQVLEEGLLAILNGQTDKRFQLDHPDLGGLAFRIDQLLNQLMGVEEDTTDEQGRESKAPNEAALAAFSMGDTGEVSPAALAALAAEPAEQYYARIYREYIAAKKSLGEQTDHITDAVFRGKIQGMEQEASAKYGKAVRYSVQTRGKEVQLLAIQLG
ncbi:MAG: MXAN_5187 C-terminal domain-containing protein, partial [Polyangiaceae bacterium]